MSSDFAAFTITATLPTEALRGLSTATVEALDLEIAREYAAGDLHRQFAEARLTEAGVTDLSEWTEIGWSFRDLSGWDECEGKFEYHHEDRRLLVRTADLEQAREAWLAAQATPLTYSPFAGLL